MGVVLETVDEEDSFWKTTISAVWSLLSSPHLCGKTSIIQPTQLRLRLVWCCLQIGRRPRAASTLHGRPYLGDIGWYYKSY